MPEEVKLSTGGAGRPEMRVLLCDDDPAFLAWERDTVGTVLRRMGYRALIVASGSGESIPEDVITTCDIAILDIDFPRKQYNGLDIARRLRAARRDTVIIFVTNYIEFAPEGYEVQAFRYGLKSEISRKLEQYLAQAVAQLRSVRRTLQIQISGEYIELLLDDILYLESRRHTAVAYVRRGSGVKTYSFYASLTSLEESLGEQGFLRVHKSYLVNMRHIQKYQCKEAVLTGGVRLRVSEKSYSEQKKKYLLWKGGQ